MLARRLPGILPRMSHDESLDVTRIHRVAGILPAREALVRKRPSARRITMFLWPADRAAAPGSLVPGGQPWARERLVKCSMVSCPRSDQESFLYSRTQHSSRLRDKTQLELRQPGWIRRHDGGPEGQLLL